MVPNIVIELLTEVYKYYPIGMSQITDSYHGLPILKERIESKITEISENQETIWKRFVGEVKRSFPSYTVFDYGYLQFPNYVLHIELKKDEGDEICFTKYLILNISLLTNFYTTYFEDLLKVKRKSGDFSNISALYYNIAYFDSCVDPECFNNALILKKLTESYFHGRKFVEHKLLFDYTLVGGTKYGDDPSVEKKNSLFEFLFNNDSPPSVILD